MKKSFTVVFALTLMSIAGFAQGRDSYFGKTTVNAGGLDIAVQSFRNTVPMVALENRSGRPARCSATFSNGLQFSDTRSVTVAAGKRATVGTAINYITAKVDIDVKCA
ncbi:hypothetical protein D3871_26510 [Noviherbaspirillum saxi]|uniref:3-phosphoglycerate kinase n=1 Tax=Noviherbaspirillum saxi TaxID=2320863 RepID=A0A3A3FI50_9BURK|nr:hypothetical protein D3871_26510 [Noviherbaspirillum saxi]